MRRCIAQWEADGPVHAFGIRVGAPAELTGTVEVQFDQPYLTPGQVNISYGLYPAWRGRGLATRAVELACQHAAAYGAVGAVIKADPGNPASAAVARRVGFVPVRRGADEDGSVMNWFGRELSIRRKPNRQHSPTTLKSQT
ncbi:GNAT family N-acetyltransferase [Streptomyces lunaelactis]|uniref:GNAT family N-acetyltransferase n=1 Tax=Streptomyces lunaelactis TaxID=1535768 RepID=UPI002815C4BC|nr:GNAT family protein [Streptomyces lunaelactis]